MFSTHAVFLSCQLIIFQVLCNLNYVPLSQMLQRCIINTESYSNKLVWKWPICITLWSCTYMSFVFFLLDLGMFFSAVYFALCSNLWFTLNPKLIRIFLFVLVKIMDSEIKPLPFDWWFPHFLSVWHCESYLTSLNLSESHS